MATFMGYPMTKLSMWKNKKKKTEVILRHELLYPLPSYAIPKSIRLKVNVIARLEFELAYNDITVITSTTTGFVFWGVGAFFISPNTISTN